MTSDEKWTIKTVQIGRVRIQYEHRSPKCLWGRFGGGWNWELGFQCSSSTLIINLLTFSIRIDKVHEKRPTPMIDRIIAGVDEQ